LGAPQAAKPDDCEVQIVRGSKPDREFIRIARLDVHVAHATWSQPTFEDVLPELRKQACRAGADAVVDIEELTSRYLETRRLHVIGTAIKWKEP
jgi:hypothetical protein